VTIPLLPTLGVWELTIVLVLVMIFFGVGKLPQVGAALGKGIKSFKDAQKGDGDGDGDGGGEIDVTPEDVDEA